MGNLTPICLPTSCDIWERRYALTVPFPYLLLSNMVLNLFIIIAWTTYYFQSLPGIYQVFQVSIRYPQFFVGSYSFYFLQQLPFFKNFSCSIVSQISVFPTKYFMTIINLYNAIRSPFLFSVLETGSIISSVYLHMSDLSYMDQSCCSSMYSLYFPYIFLQTWQPQYCCEAQPQVCHCNYNLSNHILIQE